MDLNWLTALGGLGVGTAAGNYLSGGRQRRELRAAVLTVLAELESARWSPRMSPEDFEDLVRRFQTAALIATLPQKIVGHYLTVAHAAFSQVRSSVRAGRSGGIEAHLSILVGRSARLVSSAAWHPLSTRVKLRYWMRRLDHQMESLDAETRKRIKRALSEQLL